jgi:hypothetical protein
MWKKYGTARQATDNNIIQRMRFVCWITKATDTHRICNTYCFSTAAMVTRTHLSVTFIRTLSVLLPVWKESMCLARSVRHWASYRWRYLYLCTSRPSEFSEMAREATWTQSFTYPLLMTRLWGTEEEGCSSGRGGKCVLRCAQKRIPALVWSVPHFGPFLTNILRCQQFLLAPMKTRSAAFKMLRAYRRTDTTKLMAHFCNFSLRTHQRYRKVSQNICQFMSFRYISQSLCYLYRKLSWLYKTVFRQMYTLCYLLFNTVYIKNSPTCFDYVTVHLQGLNCLLFIVYYCLL